MISTFLSFSLLFFLEHFRDYVQFLNRENLEISPTTLSADARQFISVNLQLIIAPVLVVAVIAINQRLRHILYNPLLYWYERLRCYHYGYDSFITVITLNLIHGKYKKIINVLQITGGKNIYIAIRRGRSASFRAVGCISKREPLRTHFRLFPNVYVNIRVSRINGI